jgi:choline dehydrogenase-like flavoprotein
VTDTSRTDVLIVGSGIMGSVVARLLREADPALDITMVDGGNAIGEAPGLHLHDLDDPVLWSRYNEQVATGIQGMYTGAEVVREVADSLTDLTPGMFHALAFGEDAEAMPATALAWNAGGMGVHWTAATPWPAGDERARMGPGVRVLWRGRTYGWLNVCYGGWFLGICRKGELRTVRAWFREVG